MRLWYFLRFDTPVLDQMAKEWEEAAAKYVRQKYGDNPLIKVSLREVQLDACKNKVSKIRRNLFLWWFKPINYLWSPRCAITQRRI